MALQVGIVGLPNAGKSTIFNALTKSSVPAENFPFSTIDPNVGVVAVPDDRLDALDSIVHASRIIPATVSFVDIAGLVRGAADGEGLGNQFLAHIRETDAIVYMLRAFKDESIVHVEGRIDPLDDLLIINTEIGLKDIETLEKLLAGEAKKLRVGDKDAIKRSLVLEKIKETLLGGQYDISLDEEEKELIKECNLLSLKPKIYVLNVSEDQLHTDIDFPYNHIKISAKFEAELANMPDLDKKEFLAMAGIDKPGIMLLAEEAYRTLGLIHFLTAGEMEVRAWTIKKGTKAPDAAGVIHTDFRDKFIRLEVVSFVDYMKYGGWNEAKEKGLLKAEGKEYVVADGDVVLVRHS